jgi:ATP-dependent Clp protease protease subunit
MTRNSASLQYLLANEAKGQQAGPMGMATAETDGGETEIYFYGDIIDSFWLGNPTNPPVGLVTQESLKKALDNAAGKPILLRIHSAGGDVWVASAMRAMLMTYPGKVTCRIDGLCASAATMIAISGEKVVMQDSAYLMIHDPWTIAIGNEEELKKSVAMLKETKQGLIQAYKNKTGLDENKLDKMMKDETWMSAQTALDYGFVDEIVTKPISKEANNMVKNTAGTVSNALKGFEKVPEFVRSLFGIKGEKPKMPDEETKNVTEEPGSSVQDEASEAEADMAKENHAKAVQALREKLNQVQKEGEHYDISL